MKVTFPVMSYFKAVVERRPEKKIQAYMGFFFFFFFFRLITAKISFIFTSLSAVQIYDFHIFTTVLNKQSWKGKQIHKKIHEINFYLHIGQ